MREEGKSSKVVGRAGELRGRSAWGDAWWVELGRCVRDRVRVRAGRGRRVGGCSDMRATGACA
eukprot:2604483-Pleurochrysis_carterae.AAC.1